MQSRTLCKGKRFTSVLGDEISDTFDHTCYGGFKIVKRDRFYKKRWLTIFIFVRFYVCIGVSRCKMKCTYVAVLLFLSNCILSPGIGIWNSQPALSKRSDQCAFLHPRLFGRKVWASSRTFTYQFFLPRLFIFSIYNQIRFFKQFQNTHFPSQ